MEIEVIKMTPDQLSYKDRGKMKWQGLILADMTEALKQIEKDDLDRFPNAKELMSEIEVSSILQQSYVNKLPVAIQANILRDGHFYPDVKCVVAGFKDEQIYLTLKDGRVRICKMEDIRNIQFMDTDEWYEK